MIIQEQSPLQTAFKQCIDSSLSQLQSNPLLQFQPSTFHPYLSLANADHLKQTIRSIPKLNIGSIRYLLTYFNVLMQQSTCSKMRELNWRAMYVLVEKIIVDDAEGDQEVSEALLKESLAQVRRYPFGDRANTPECRNLLQVYLALLCLRHCRPLAILEITLLVVGIDDLDTELGGQLYKLDEWLSQRKLNFTETVMLANIVSRGKLGKQLEVQNYKWKLADLKYRKLLPVLINCLFDCEGADRDRFLIALTEAVFDEQALLEVYLYHLNNEKSNTVIQAVFRYISWQMLQSISVKKVKLLLKCLKMPAPNPDQTTIQLCKLNSYVNILKDLARRYPDACAILNFQFNSSLILQNYAQKNSTVTILVEITEIKEQLALINVGHKKGMLRITVEPESELKKMLVVKLKEKTLLREVIKNGGGERCEFLISVAARDQQVYIHVNSLQFMVKEQVNLTEIVVGSCDFEHSFTGRLKALVMFTKDVSSQTIYKDWMDCECRLQALLQRKDPDHILVKMSRKQSLFIVRQKTKGFLQKMFERQPKFTLKNTTKTIMSSFLQIIQQLGDLDCFLYFIQYISALIPDNPQTVQILSGLFSILKMLCIYDEFYRALDWVQKSLMSLGHLLWIVFSKNKEAAQAVRLILKVFDFLLYFERKLKHEKTKEQLATCYRNLECQIIKIILLNFDIWILCGLTQQRFVLKVIEKRLTDQTILQNLQDSNSLGSILLSLLIHYNPAFHTDNKILTQKNILDLQNQIIQICSKLIRQQSPSVQLDFHTLILYLFVSQQPNLNYQCPTIFQNLLHLISNPILNRTPIRKLLSDSNSPVTQRLHLFFCRLLKTCSDPQTCELIIDVNFRLMELLLPEDQDSLLHGMLTFLTVRSRQGGLYLRPYVGILRRVDKMNNLGLKIARVVNDLRQCYKLVKKFQDIDELEDLVMGLPQEVLIPLINSDQGFDFLLTISIQQPQIKPKIQQLLQNLFIYCFSSPKPQLSLPFIRNYLKILPKVDLPSSSPLPTTHLLCQLIDSKYLITMLFHNQLVTVTPGLNFMIAAEEISGYPGGVLGHLLARNTFSIEDLGLLKGILGKRDRRVERYAVENNLVEYFLPDVIFLDALWTLLRMYLQEHGLKRKLSVSLSSSKIESDKEEATESMLIPEAAKLLSFMKDCLQYESLWRNVVVFAQCQETLNLVYQLLNKEPTKQNLLKNYLQMNSRLEMEIPNIAKQNLPPNPILQQLSQKLKVSNYEQAYKFIQSKRKDFEQLLKFMNKYAKKDIIVMKKVCFKSPTIDLFQQLPSLPSSQSSFRQQKVNQMLSHFEQKFRTALVELDSNSQKSEQLWQTISNRNRFWLWDKKSDNDVYKIDLHETPNFYHLNIKIGKTEHMAHYPRRKQVTVPAILKKRPIRADPGSMMASALNASTISTPEKKMSASLAVLPVEDQQKIVEKKSTYYAEYVTQRGVYFGLMHVKDNKLYFNSLPETDRPPEKEYQYSTSQFHKKQQPCIKRLDLHHAVLFTRRYIMRHTAIQLFNKKKSYFFNLFFEDKRKAFINEIKDFVICIQNRRQQFQKHQFTRKWLNGQLNNFEYLMLINRYSGRTYHDLSQYPVFPWVISNYSSPVFNKDFLKTPGNLRNLQLPMGRLNQKRFQSYKQRLRQCRSDPSNYFLYGSFYSNPTFIYNFFIRLEPFTTLHWQHQGKKIDHADRLFYGIEEQYKSACVNSSDVRECVPEFYYWPEFLRNRNQIELGKKQNKEEVNNTKLPNWAKTPEEFIFRMREALESKQVTEQLAAWIDLVFGYKAAHEEAEKYDNLFAPYSYEQDIFKLDDIDTIRMAQLNISQFGQVPQQLFTQQHPRKKPRHGLMLDYFRLIFSHKGCQKFQLFPQGMMLTTPKQVFFLSTTFSIVSKVQIKYFETVSSNCSVLHGREFSWVAVKDNTMFVYINKKQKHKTYKLESPVYLVTSKDVLVRAVGSQLWVQRLPVNGEDLEKPQKQYGHQERIYKVVVNESLDVLVSVDEDQLVLVHYLTTLKCLRSFKLKLNIGEKIVELRIHDMGYYVFLTSENRLLIYTYMGELFVQSDLSTEFDGEQITNLQFVSQWQSLVLLSTNFGNIYQMDFFQFWRFKQSFPHLPFKLRPKKNILAKCRSDLSRNQRYRDVQRPAILQFSVLKILGLFRILVLYADGQLLCFLQQQMMKEQFENSPLIKQMGLV